MKIWVQSQRSWPNILQCHCVSVKQESQILLTISCFQIWRNGWVKKWFGPNDEITEKQTTNEEMLRNKTFLCRKISVSLKNSQRYWSTHVPEKIQLTKTLSNAEGLPPRCTCPNTVILVSCCSLSTTTFLICSAVIGSPFRSIAPSATMIILSRCPTFLS